MRIYGTVTCYKSAHSLPAGITANINMYLDLAIVVYLSKVDGHILSILSTVNKPYMKAEAPGNQH